MSSHTSPYDEKNVEDITTEEGIGSEILNHDRVAEEKALRRKLDFRILPITCFLYLCGCKHYIT